jgi:folate-binding protein YgfZ
VAGELHYHALGDLRLIRVAGPERGPFLQGQITQDVDAVHDERTAHYGWATAQGRLLVTGQIFAWRDALWLTAPAELAASVTRRLGQYVLRAKVSVALADVALVGAHGVARPLHIGDAVLPAGSLAAVATADWCAMRVAGDPARVLIAADTSAPGQPSARAPEPDAWRLADIRAGIPRLAPSTSESFVPQMVNLDLLGGIAFGKGCYTGQEIVTRTRHLGRVTRRMLRFACTAGITPAAGDPIFAGDREAGRIVSAAATGDGMELLAVTLLDRLAQPLHADAGGHHALARLPLPYRVPEAEESG